MSVSVKYFASLREELEQQQRGQSSADAVEIAYHRDMTIADVWQALSDQPPPNNLLCARNWEFSSFEETIADGDEIAFFPPVTGG